MPQVHIHLQVRSPVLAKASPLTELLPTISKSSVVGQCLSLLDAQAKAALESKMKVALHKTMRAELKSTCLGEAHGAKARDALVDHFKSCQEDVSTMRHALPPKQNQVIFPISLSKPSR